MAKDKNYVSVWFWLFAMFVVTIPCIGLVMIFLWAFLGDNESRKNYFRALILVGFFWAVFWVAIVSLGYWPDISGYLREQVQHLQQWSHWPK